MAFSEAIALLSPAAPEEAPIPPAATVSSPVPAILCCHRRIASGANPLITSGVSIACIESWPDGCELCSLVPAPWLLIPDPRSPPMGRARTSSICAMGVMPAMGSLLNCPTR